jgi:general secretion pathway protein G
MKRHIAVILSAWLKVPPVSTIIFSFVRQRRTWISRAITLVELVIVMAMVGILAAIGVPAYNNYIEKVKISQAIEDIRFIEAALKLFLTEHKVLPDTLNQVPLTQRLDPWHNPYQYLRIEGKDKDEIKGKWRKDHFNVPVNSDFDLYSMGKDGESKSPFTAKASRDDIVRASDGAYVGLVSEY